MKSIIILLIIALFLLNACKTKAEKAEDFNLLVSKELFQNKGNNVKQLKEKITNLVVDNYKPDSYFIEYKNYDESEYWVKDHKFDNTILDSLPFLGTFKVDEFRYNIHAIYDYWFDYIYYKNQNSRVTKFTVYSIYDSAKFASEDGVDINTLKRNEQLTIYIETK
jgi:hypothetical protein